MYDHDEGRAVTDGFAYHGRIAALQSKFVFGDIFAADLAELKKADDGIPQTVARIEEVQLYVRDASGNRIGVSMRELVERTMATSLPRVDLHISRHDGELLLTSRQDGAVRMLVPIQPRPQRSGHAADKAWPSRVSSAHLHHDEGEIVVPPMRH